MESVNDILITLFDLKRTCHGSVKNAYDYLLAALTAYCFYDHKPAVFFPNSIQITCA
ncbi:hypothetical protein [Adhaeribacter radiodurans]|uniref:Uncharacterized protein n=1 Tax=Adhaeribacter radiodurans TaxID=2745197 RepID=A0A7L7L6L3_9BACT|nr:hypothetical protein [Adhaeribacter radiodurans]QMU28155.1 hypothetical protein HUW48_08915 [Adhaeribacter radiodurans]